MGLIRHLELDGPLPAWPAAIKGSIFARFSTGWRGRKDE